MAEGYDGEYVGGVADQRVDGKSNDYFLLPRERCLYSSQTGTLLQRMVFVTKISRQIAHVASAMAWLHKRKIAHGDIKGVSKASSFSLNGSYGTNYDFRQIY